MIGSPSSLFHPYLDHPIITPPEIWSFVELLPCSDGADVENTVAHPIQQQISVVYNLKSACRHLNSNTGHLKPRVNFDENSDAETDQVETQMRQSQAGIKSRRKWASEGLSVEKSCAAPAHANRSPLPGWGRSDRSIF